MHENSDINEVTKYFLKGRQSYSLYIILKSQSLYILKCSRYTAMHIEAREDIRVFLDHFKRIIFLSNVIIFC